MSSYVQCRLEQRARDVTGHPGRKARSTVGYAPGKAGGDAVGKGHRVRTPGEPFPQIGEVNLGLRAGGVVLRYEHLADLPSSLREDLRAAHRDVGRDRGIRQIADPVLVHQAGQHPPGGVPLLLRGGQVLTQHQVDRRFVRVQPGRR